MVQSTMGLAPYQPINYEYLDAVPQQQKIKKKIQKGGEWVDRIFIRVPMRDLKMNRQTAENGYRSCSELEEWCRQHYNEPRYLGPWFKVSDYIILDEQVYTHWKLCE